MLARVATLREIEESWSIVDVYEAGDVLDLQAEANATLES